MSLLDIVQYGERVTKRLMVFYLYLFFFFKYNTLEIFQSMFPLILSFVKLLFIDFILFFNNTVMWAKRVDSDWFKSREKSVINATVKMNKNWG